MDSPILPTPSCEFLSHLSKHPQTPTRELLQPYLAYELQLRKAFALDDTKPDHLANLVPIYNGQESSFKVRMIDRKTSDREKYIMSHSDDSKDLEADGKLAIAASLKEYKMNFEAFTHGALSGLDWSNVVAAGSSALLPLLSRKDVNIQCDPAVEDPLEKYFEVTASTSDIDLFLYGLDSEESAVARIIELSRAIRKSQRLSADTGTVLRTEHAITFISPRYPFRHIQIILRLYKSISEILTGFDVDCSCVAFDGKQVYSNPRGITAIATRCNTIELSRRSPSYENRLYKYRNHGFEVYWDSLERSRINDDNCYPDEDDPQPLTGLARLIYYEKVLGSEGNPYLRKRLLKRIDSGGEPMLTMPSGYATHELPYGERFTATRVRKFVVRKAKNPYIFGTIYEVTAQGNSATKKEQGNDECMHLSGKLVFIKNDPGRQMIGSFHPLSQHGWTEMAYGDETPSENENYHVLPQASVEAESQKGFGSENVPSDNHSKTTGEEKGVSHLLLNGAENLGGSELVKGLDKKLSEKPTFVELKGKLRQSSFLGEFGRRFRKGKGNGE